MQVYKELVTLQAVGRACQVKPVENGFIESEQSMIDCQSQLIFSLLFRKRMSETVVMEGYLTEHAGRAYFFTGSSQYYYKLDGILKALVRIFRSEKLDVGD